MSEPTYTCHCGARCLGLDGLLVHSRAVHRVKTHKPLRGSDGRKIPGACVLSLAGRAIVDSVRPKVKPDDPRARVR